MTPEQKKENEELLDMFAHPGWEHFIKRVDVILEPLQNIRNVQSNEDLWIKRGEVRNLDWIKSFPDLVRLALDEDDL